VTTPRWGFVGLGQMGTPMAARIAGAGLPLTVLCRRPAHQEAAAAMSASAATDVRQLAEASDVVSVCVRDERQIDELMVEAGLLAAARRGTVFAIHSTVGAQECRRLHGLAVERGLSVVDAPVSGLPVRARSGELAIFVGGSAADVDLLQPGLLAMGRPVHTGPVGSGQITKLLNNLVSLSTIAAIVEALRLADQHGMSRTAVREALGNASADSFTLRSWDYFECEWLEPGPGLVTDMVAKDLRLAVALDPRAPSIMAEAANRALRRHLLGDEASDAQREPTADDQGLSGDEG
jgi:3-hydroxyisobutyrate dehydrogenase